MDTFDTEEYCSTREAAKLLGVSLGTVQNMVERGTLVAWKTAGGHRRVSVRAVDALLQKRRPGHVGSASAAQGKLRVVVAGEDKEAESLYLETMNGWDLNLDIHTMSGGCEALIYAVLKRPDVLLLDLNLPDMDVLAAIRAFRQAPDLSGVNIIAMGDLPPSLDHRDPANRLPSTVTRFRKPVPFHELHGYFRALMTQLRSRGAAYRS